MFHTSRRLAVAAAMIVSALGLTAMPAAAEPASLTVAVTDAATGAPISNPCVSVFEAPWSFVSRVCGGADGVVTVTGLDSAQNYKANVQGPPEYAQAFVGGGTSMYSAAVFSVPRTDTVALSLAAGAAGTLLDPSGAPAVGYSVTVTSVNDIATSGWAQTDATGRWTTQFPLPPGDYEVRFSDTLYRSAWAYGKTSEQAADVITLAAGQTVTVDDTFTLEPRGQITGKVLDAETNEPLSDICVSALRDTIEFTYGTVSCTQPDGTFAVDDLIAGSYILQYSDYSNTYATRYSGGAYRISGADEIVVAAPGAAAAPNIKLRKGAVLHGAVVDPEGHPVAGVCPQAHLAGQYYYGQATQCSDESGTWSISGLAPKTFTVNLVPPRGTGTVMTWLPGVADPKDATRYKFTSGQSVDVGTVTLVAGGTVTGRVTDQATGEPIAGIGVDLSGTTDHESVASS